MNHTPPAQLASAYAKIERARESIDALAADMRAYLAKAGYRREAVAVSAGELFRVVGPSLPLRFAVLTGEIAHHLRSSLDHLVWALVRENTGEDGSRFSEFPVMLSMGNEHAAKAFERKISGVRDDAATAIRSVQPYQQPNPRIDPLWLVHDLDRIDKHRLLLATVAVAHLHAVPGSGAEEMMLKAPIGTPKSDVQIDRGFSLQIHLCDVPDIEEGVVPLLAYLTKYVESVLHLFWPAFSTVGQPPERRGQGL